VIKPSQGDGFLRAIKIHSTPSFRGEIKILWHVRNHFSANKDASKAKIHNFLCQVPPDLLVDGSAGRMSRECSDGQISFLLLISFHHGSLCTHITWGIKNRPVGGRSSET
jgi:transcription elongation factor GreA-like protein